MLPEGWSEKRFTDIAESVMGYAFKSTDFVEDGIPLIRMGNLYQNRLDLNRNPVFLPESFLNEFERFQIRPGDILLSMTGTAGKQDYGFAVRVPDDYRSLLLNQRVARIRAKSEHDQHFILYLMQSKQFLSEIYSNPGGTKQANIGAGDLAEIVLKVPPFKEQQKIAKILSTWDEAIEKLEKLIKSKKSFRMTFVNNILSGRGELFNHADWSSVKLEDLAEFRRGSFPQPYDSPEWYDDENGMPFVQVYDVDTNTKLKQTTKRKISKLGATKSVFVPKGSILVTIQGSIGRVAITQYDAYVDRTLLIFKSFKRPISANFLVLVLKNLFFIEAQKAPGGTIKTITKEALSSFEVLVPEIEIQEKIGGIAELLDKQIELLEFKKNKIVSQKQGLMQQLLTGNKRVVL